MKEEAVSVQKSLETLVLDHQLMNTSEFKDSALNILKTTGESFLG